MTSAELILVILACIYAAESGFWVRPGSLLFVSRLGIGFRLRLLYFAALLRNDHGGLMFGNLLPLGHSILAPAFPLSLSLEGAASVDCQTNTPDGRADEADRFHRWEDMKAVVAEGRKILVDGELFVRAATADQAKHIVTLLRQIRSLPTPVERESAIATAIREMLDHEAFARRYDQHSLRSMPLLFFCALLAGYLFVVMPWSLDLFEVRAMVANVLGYFPSLAKYVFGRRIESGLPLGALTETQFVTILLNYFQLLGLTILAYWIVHMWLGRPSGERWSNTLMMLVSPADAMHAHDNLFRNIAIGFHPLTVARVLARKAEFHELARLTLLDLRFPLPRPPVKRAAAVVATEEWFRRELGSALEHFIAGSGLDVAELVRPSKPERADSLSFCPRCQGQYVISEGMCTVCELPLVRSGTEPMTKWECKPQPVLPAKPQAEAKDEPAPAPTKAKGPPSKETPRSPSKAERRARRRERRKKRRDEDSAPDRTR